MPTSGEKAPEEQVTQPIAVRRKRRTINAPARFSPSLYYLLLTDCDEPSCYEEAMSSDKSEDWGAAMEDEMNSLQRNFTWDLVKKPPGKKAIQKKWVYRLKQESDGT